MEASSTCPKCGQRREQEWSECPFCGVIYAKVAASRAATPPAVEGDVWGGGSGAAAAAMTGPSWGVPAPAAGAWGAAPPPPPQVAADLYRPPSAPVGEALWLSQRSAADLAGRGTRLAAQLVDSLVAVPLVLVFVLPPLLVGDGSDMAMTAGAVAGLLFGLAVLAINLRLLSMYGQTIGKKVVGIRIVRLDGQRAGLGRILLLRMIGPSLLASIPYAGTLFAFVNYLFIFRDDRRCVHDHMADTKVVVG